MSSMACGDHYRATGLTERLKTALTALGPRIMAHAEQLAPRPVSRARSDHRAAQRWLGSPPTCRFLMSARGTGALSGRDLWLPGYGVDPSQPFVDAVI